MKKRVISFLLITALLISISSVMTIPTFAATYSGSCGDNVTWVLDTSTGVLTISGTGDMADYTSLSPSKTPWYSYRNYIKTANIEYGVTRIGNNAFDYCELLTSVTIPESVKSVGGFAFNNCDALTAVTIPNSVTSIESHAFCACDLLESITIPYSVTNIGKCVFHASLSLTTIIVDPDNKNYTSVDGVLFNKNKTTLIIYPMLKTNTEYSIPDTVTTIEEYAFHLCEKLTSIIIPESVTNIGGGAFSNCTSLKSITIPSSVTTLKDFTFSCCDSLKSVVIPESVTTIEKFAFHELASLATVYYTGSQVQWNKISIGPNNSPLNNAVKVYDYRDFTWSYNESSGTLTITGNGPVPDYEKGKAPWYDLQFKVYSINIGEGITSIGKGAFAYMYYARSLSLPKSLKKIESNAFYYCMSLEEVIIPESVTYLGGGAFSYCYGLESISVPTSITTVYSYTFYDCNKLSNIYYADTKTKWNKITIESGNEFLANANIMVNTTAGTTWNYENGTLIISGYGRMENYTSKSTPWNEYTDKIKKIIVKEGVTGLGNYAFGYCYYVTEVQLPNTLVHIGSNVFYNCMSLEKIDIPTGVRRIYGATFYNCKKLDNILIPLGVDTIYAHTFMGCTSLKNVSYNGTNVQWQKINILNNNQELTNCDINYTVNSINWNLSDDGTLTISGRCKMDDYELNKVPMAPWADVKLKIKKVVIEYGVPNIGKNAFYGCYNLTEVQIPESVTSIGYGAFMSTSLKKISIPANVTYIGSSAFNGCALLTEVNIPAGVTNIYSYTFYNCKRLNKVTLEGDKANINIIATGNEYFTALVG